MQTVNEAAKENAEKYWVSDSRYKSSIASFNAGVEFAQRWIPVEDESPEERVFVLCQNPFSVFVASFHGKEKGFRIPNAEGEYKVTHWRPIEYPLL